MMEHVLGRRLRGALCALWLAVAPALAPALAQESRIAVGDAANGQQISWWVVGSGGGVMGGGDLSGTAGQTAIKQIGDARTLAYLGYWLPDRNAAAVSSQTHSDASAALAAGAFPNPFRTSTSIGYSLERVSHVRVRLFDMTGTRVRELVDEPQAPGRQGVVWDGADASGVDLGSGSYLYTIEATPLGEGAPGNAPVSVRGIVNRVR